MFLKNFPTRLVPRSPEKSRGFPSLLQEAAAGSSHGWASSENYQRLPWCFLMTRLGTIASWGFGVSFYHSEQVIHLACEKLWNKCNNQTRITTKLGRSLCTVTNAHHRCFELFLSNEELSFLFSLFLFLFFVKTKHAAYLVYAVRGTLEGEETNEQKIPALLTTRTQAGMTESASTWRQPVFFTSPFFFPAFTILIYFIVYDTKEWQRTGKSCASMWLKNWPLVWPYVCLVTGG